MAARSFIEPSVLVDVAIIMVATLSVGAVIAVGLIWLQRSRQWKRHRRIARQKRRDATRIDVSGPRKEGDDRSTRSHRRRRHSRGRHFTIDIVKRQPPAQEEPPSEDAAAEEPRPGAES